jgi:hypothetical protein
VGYTEGAIPTAGPVCFVVGGDDLVGNPFDGEGPRRGLYRALLACQVADIKSALRGLWAVVGAGHVRLITDPVGLTSWVSPDPVAAVRIEYVTGRAVGPGSGWGEWR